MPPGCRRWRTAYWRELQQAEACGWRRRPVQQGACLGIAGAENAAPGGHPAEGDAKAAKGREGDRMGLDPAADHTGKAAQHDDENAAEDAAHRPADDAADRHRQPIRDMTEADMRRAEIGVVAQNGLGGEARHDDGGDDQAAGLHLEGFRQLLDAEDHPRQRRVEGRGDAARTATMRPAGARATCAGGIHERGATCTVGPRVRSRPREKPQRRQDDLADGDLIETKAARQGLILDLARRDRLGMPLPWAPGRGAR